MWHDPIQRTVPPLNKGLDAGDGDSNQYQSPIEHDPDGSKPLAEDFSVSPTGRRSNSAYDVTHAWLTILMDSQRMPEFFEVLNEVNFMTVLSMKVTDVDEYEAFQQGYIFGEDDVVEVELLIESVWLRTWTEPFMPNIIKSLLGVLQPDDEGFEDPRTYLTGTPGSRRGGTIR